MNFAVEKTVLKAFCVAIKASFGVEFKMPTSIDGCVTCLETIRDKVLEGRSRDLFTTEGKIHAEVTSSIEKIERILGGDIGRSDVIGIADSVKNIMEELKKIR